MGFKLGGIEIFSTKNRFQSIATGGLTTAHDLNKAGHHKLFPKGTDPAAPPPAPTIDDAEAAAMDKEEQLRRRRGMAATILGGLDTTSPTVQTPSLLGS